MGGALAVGGVVVSIEVDALINIPIFFISRLSSVDLNFTPVGYVILCSCLLFSTLVMHIELTDN
jgi:hypothetical protein